VKWIIFASLPIICCPSWEISSKSVRSVAVTTNISQITSIGLFSSSR
jgi:hypothetical protein